MAARVATKKIGVDEKKKITAMLQQMTDPSKADPKIVLPKCEDCHHLFNEIFAELVMFAGDSNIRANFTDQNAEFEEIIAFVKESMEFLKLDDDEETFKDDKDINARYAKFKDGLPTQHLIATAGKIKPYEVPLTEMRTDFVTTMVDFLWQPFEFSSINMFPIIQNSDRATQNKILRMLIITYEKTKEIYNLITSPDVDVEELSETLIQAIVQLKHQIPGCDDAFNIISNSVDTFKDRFSGYYREMIVSKNPNVLMENFLVDLATSDKIKHKGIKLKSQFNKIINLIKNRANDSNLKKDKNLGGMFDVLDGYMKVLEDKDEDKDSGEAPPLEPAPTQAPPPKTAEQKAKILAKKKRQAAKRKQQKAEAEAQAQVQVEINSEDEDEDDGEEK
jgi:hypothetical protein